MSLLFARLFVSHPRLALSAATAKCTFFHYRHSRVSAKNRFVEIPGKFNPRRANLSDRHWWVEVQALEVVVIDGNGKENRFCLTSLVSQACEILL